MAITAAKDVSKDKEAEVNKYLDGNSSWQGTKMQSLQVAGVTLFGTASTVYLIIQVANGHLLGGSYLARALLTFLYGLWIMRVFIVFHDCGHGSFFQGFPGASQWNNVCHHLFGVVCATPREWSKAHHLHHKHVGNIGQDVYDWGETIFHTKGEYLAMPAWKRTLYKIFRNPVIFFVLAPILVWYVKFNLPVTLRAGRAANYPNSSKALNLVLFILRRYLAYKLGISIEMWVGDWIAMFLGVLLFHCQHAFNDGYVRDKDWNRFDAAVSGSSFLVLPTWFKFFTLGIEYHHIHHHRSRMPGYMLRDCHDKADPSLWSGVTFLDGPAIWTTIWNTLYDDETQLYTTFAEAEKGGIKSQ